MKKSNKKTKRRVIYWEAADWTVEKISPGIARTDSMDESNQGMIRHDEKLLTFRYMNDDQAILCIIHEMLHKAFPLIEDEETIKRAEVVLKSGFEAFDVDLTPMLQGYK